MACACALLLPSESNAETLAGRVLDPSGAPVAGASVRLESASEVLVTGPRGAFELAADVPLVLEVSHPDFELERLELASLPAGVLDVVLRPSGTVVREEIAVSASRTQGNFAPQSVAVSTLRPEASPALPSAVGDLVVQVPGVSQNGQGGLFQTYSVRGVSRQRVLTLVEGVRIVGERRAGVSASFLDPLLLGSVEVVRGPSSTYWGSGALGGVVQLFPRRFSGISVASGYSSQGGERFVRAGTGAGSTTDGWSLGIAARAADSSETPRGDELFSGFQQVSTALVRNWSSARTDFRALVVVSNGDDIGKSSTEFPERVTTYPSETHAILNLSASRAEGWRFEIYAHPNRLDTRVERPGRELSEVENRAFDWGVDLQRELAFSDRSTARWGVDLFARSDVDAREQTRDAQGVVVLEERTLSNASERELGVYGAIETTFPGSGVTVLTGGRLAHQRQENAAPRGTDDFAATGFVGVVAPIARRYELTANLGTGLRFPSISERYFTGTTGRGVVEGNPELDPERSVSADVGLRFTADRVFVAVSLFRSEIDHYIERLEVAPGRLSFVNLASGRIEGLELEGAWRATADWSVSFGGHSIAGEERGGQALADIPADRYYAGWTYEPVGKPARWSFSGRWERRFSKSDAGSGEKPIPAADLVSSSLSRRVRDGLSLRLSASNLLDREYFNSADELLPLSPGRSVSLSMEWRPSAPSPW